MTYRCNEEGSGHTHDRVDGAHYLAQSAGKNENNMQSFDMRHSDHGLLAHKKDGYIGGAHCGVTDCSGDD